MAWLPKIALAAIAAVCAAAAAGQGMAPARGSSDSSDLVRRALALEHGEGVAKDPRKAAALYCEAALQFDAEAHYHLAWMYAYGRGVSRDDGIAAGLFARAAAMGDSHAADGLKLMGDAPRTQPPCLSAGYVPPPITPARFARLQVSDYPGPNPFEDLPPWKRQIADVVETLAPRYEIDTRLALAVIAVESNFDATALSNKGAAGLMQLIPATAQRFNVKNQYDVRDNVRGGLAYLRWLLSYYQGHVPLAAAAYNAGEVAVDRYRGIPPYGETRDYVRRVLRLYGREKHPYDAQLVAPSSAVVDAFAGQR